MAKKHGLELAPGMRLEHARVAFAVGLLGAAKESLTVYLMAAGREAESYRDAVTLWEDVEGILERRGAPECPIGADRVGVADGTGEPSRVLRVESEPAARRDCDLDG